MIIVQINGGLGNQMFQYAAARSLAIKLNRELVIDSSLYENSIKNREFSLNNFCIQARNDKSGKYRNKLIRKKGVLGRIFPKIFKDIEQITEKTLKSESKSEAIYLTGYWQSEKYFKNHKKDIIIDFTLKKSIDIKNLISEEKFDNKNAVAVHIRRGDYVTDKDSSDILGFVGKEYYEKAFKVIEEKIVSPIFYIFSDDIEWCKENFTNDDFVFMDKYNLKDYQEMAVMSIMGSSVIANSSFSWWAAWLGERNKQHIIAPGSWYKSKDYSSQNIIPARWIKI